MNIRHEIPSDRDLISAIHYAAFKDHSQHQPGAKPTEHLIVERLRDSRGLALSLVAESSGILVGHIALSPAVVGDDREGWFLLGPVGVMPPCQGEGIGSALVEVALAEMKGRGAAGVVLVGAPEYYGRFGFKSREVLTYPGVPPQYVLALSFALEVPRGKIKAHKAFA